MKRNGGGLFIGRFQPFHNGHLAILNSITNEVSTIIIGIGSPQYSYTKDNPFTLDERIQMISNSFTGDYTLKIISDIHNDTGWVKHVKEIVGTFDIVYSNSDWIKGLFEKEGYSVKKTPVETHITGTEIRHMVLEDKNWQLYVPKGTADIILSCGGIKRIKELYDKQKSPKLAVDIIIKLNNVDDSIILIERANPPFGWALPGGKVDYGETTEIAAIREAKEETSLDINIKYLHGVYSDQKRDPRSHVISIVYVAEATGIPKARSDAKNIGIFKKEDLPVLAFDHNQILDDYFNKLK